MNTDPSSSRSHSSCGDSSQPCSSSVARSGPLAVAAQYLLTSISNRALTLANKDDMPIERRTLHLRRFNFIRYECTIAYARTAGDNRSLGIRTPKNLYIGGGGGACARTSRARVD